MRLVPIVPMLACLTCLVCPAAAQRGSGGDAAVGVAGQHFAPLRQRSVEQILSSTRSGDPFMRANAVEAAAYLPDRLIPIAQLGMQDDAAVVRFAALATVGKLQIRDLGPAVQQQLAREKERVEAVGREILTRGSRMSEAELLRYNDLLADAESVYAAAIFASRRCGSQVDLSPLAELLGRPNPSVRGNVAILMGMLGDRNAAPMLRDMARVDMPRANPVSAMLARLQIAEARVKLGDDEALDAIRAAAYSHQGEVRVMAVTMLGRLGDQRMARGLAELLNDPPIELQLAAAASLARMRHHEGLRVALKGAESTIDAVRAQAASTLGLFDDAEAARMLGRMLDDAAEQVRLAAAAGVLEALAR